MRTFLVVLPGDASTARPYARGLPAASGNSLVPIPELGLLLLQAGTHRDPRGSWPRCQSRSALLGAPRADGLFLASDPAGAPPVAALPFAADAFDAAVAINVLDHLADPTVAIGEAHRVLAEGGSFLAATASRHDSPELAEVWRPPPASFDAESAPGLVASVFGQVRVQRWDGPLVRLPDHHAVHDYLIARFVAPGAAAAAEQVTTPVAITKRGAVIHARK